MESLYIPRESLERTTMRQWQKVSSWYKLGSMTIQGLTRHTTDLVEFRKYRADVSTSMKTDEPFSISERFHSLISLLVQDRYGIEVEVSREFMNRVNNWRIQ